MDNPFSRRRLVESAARRLLAEQVDHTVGDSGRDLPRLTLNALENIRMSRSRERILNNLDDMYREAFERAKTSGDAQQMATLDFAYRREQLYFEILLDVRDALERRG